MIWAILALAGAPLWFCVTGIIALLTRKRGLRRRPRNVPVRSTGPAGSAGRGVTRSGSDVFAWRGSPAAWREELAHVIAATPRDAEPTERKTVRRLGDAPAIASFIAADGASMVVAAAREHRSALLGPVAAVTAEPERPPLSRRQADCARVSSCVDQTGEGSRGGRS